MPESMDTPKAPNPGAAPMSTGQDPKGEQLESMVSITACIDLLDQQMLKWDPGSKEQKNLLKARKSLTKIVGKQDDDARELSPGMLKVLIAELMGPISPPPRPPQQPGAPQMQPGAQPLGPGAGLGSMAPA